MNMYQVVIHYSGVGETRWNVFAEHVSEARVKARELAGRLYGLVDSLNRGMVTPIYGARQGRLFPPTAPHRRRWKLLEEASLGHA